MDTNARQVGRRPASHRMLKPALLRDPQRSRLMARVRQKGTTPELAVRTILTDLGVEYSTNVTDLPGSPDIVAAEAKRAVFVHGCFWHRHARCPACTTPKRNAAFWNNKFEQNTARDAKKMRQLRRIGFRILKVWECQLKREDKIARLTERLAKFFAVGI
jgi:DNA mismatch endonuclease, patch repair protein